MAADERRCPCGADLTESLHDICDACDAEAMAHQADAATRACLDLLAARIDRLDLAVTRLEATLTRDLGALERLLERIDSRTRIMKTRRG